MDPTNDPSSRPFAPFVPESSDLPELTFRAVLLGTAMAIVLGTANAYLGMRAGLTVAATFPAAVVAMAALRLFGGSILEENMARTTASVGEALVAGAIFTIPAFVISGVWDELRYWESTAIMLVGGILGVLFIIVLRRTLVVEAELPFPESVAAAELVKAGQGGRQTGAKFVFQAMGVAGAWELLKNSNGIKLVADSATWFVSLGQSTIEILGRQVNYVGGFLLQSPAGVAGADRGRLHRRAADRRHTVRRGRSRLAAAGSAGPLPEPRAGRRGDGLGRVHRAEHRGVAAAGAAAGGRDDDSSPRSTPLYNLRTSLIQGIGRAFGDLGAAQAEGAGRQDIDIDFRKTGLAIAALAVPLFGLYWYFSESFGGAILLTIMMVILGFLFAAVAGYLVGLLGSSNNPISGLTLSTLLIAAIVMVGNRRHRLERHPRRAGRGRRRLLRMRHRRRHAAGPEGGPHPRRHALEDADRRADRRDHRRHGAHLADDSDGPGLRDRQPRAAGAAGRPDGAHLGGHRRRGDGLAAGHRRNGAGRRHDSHSGALADAHRGRDVPAVPVDRGHLRRRPRELVADALARRAGGDWRGADPRDQHGACCSRPASSPARR